MKININDIDLGKLAKELRRFEEQWVAISGDNRIIASGRTYGEAVDKVENPDEVVLFRVPSLDYSLAP